MAGNRSVFEAAMKRAAERAWNQDWELALADYQRAADEFPDDMAARGSLALTYYRLGNWESAAVHYAWMLERAADNAFIMHRLIEVYLKLERRSDAKKVQAHLDALQQSQRAATGALPVQVDPTNVMAPAGETSGLNSRSLDGPTTPAAPDAPTTERPVTGSLAAYELNEVVALAVAFEKNGKIGEAIRHYEQAIASGADRPDIAYSLGLLYQQQNRHADALKLFAGCLDNADYAMSATFATGVSQRALGNRNDAARMLSLSISLIDHEQIGDGELGELVTIYRTAIESLTEIGNFLQASNLAASLADFLAGFTGHEASVAAYRDLSQRLQAQLSASLAVAPAADAAQPASPALASSETSTGAPATNAPVANAPATTPPAVRVAAARAASPPPPRPAVTPMADEEAPERLASSYRRVTGNLGPEPRLGGTSSLSGTVPLGGTGRLGGTANLGGTGRLGGTTSLAASAAMDGAAAGATRSLGGTALLAARAMTPGTATLRRRQLHAHDRALPNRDQQDPAVQALLAEADADAQAGRLAGAIDACQAIVGLAPEYVAVHLRLAELYARRGRNSEALETTNLALRVLTLRNAPPTERLPFLRLIVRLRPTDEAALVGYGEAARQAGQAATAAPLIRRLVSRLIARGAASRSLTEAEQLAAALPDDLDAQRHLADTLTLLGQPEPALDVYRRLLLRRPHDLACIAGANLAFAMLNQEAHWWLSLETLVAAARAVAPVGRVSMRLHRRLVTSPIEARVRIASGLLVQSVGQPGAGSWLEPLLAADATAAATVRAVAHHAAALLAAQAGDDAAELRHRTATLALLGQPDVAQTLAPLTLFDDALTPTHLGLALADVYARQEALPEAIQTLDDLRRIVPGDETVLVRLADLQLQAGRLGAALAALDELATYHREAGRLDALAAVLDRMAQIAPNNAGIKSKLVDAYLERGFVEQASRELELCAQLHASSGKLGSAIACLQRAADIAWTLGHTDQAFALCGRMLELQPTNADARQFLITLYLQSGQLDRAVAETWQLVEAYQAENNHRDAIAALHQIIGLAPQDATAYHRLGEMLTAVGEYGQAEKVYERLLRHAPDDQVARAKRMAMANLAFQAGDTAA